MTAVIDTEAAELEGLVPATKEQIALIKKFERLRSRKDALEAEMDTIKQELGGILTEDALQGLLVNGKVMVRRSTVVTSRTDTRGLKAKYPEIAAEFMLVTNSVRITIK